MKSKNYSIINFKRDKKMAYIYLAIAILAEVTATSALKASDEFTKIIPILIIIGMGLIITGVDVINIFSKTATS